MSDKKPAIRIEKNGNTIIASCLFNRLSTEVLTHQWLEEVLNTIHEKQPAELILDFTDVTLLTSFAIQKLIDLHFMAERQHFKLAFCVTEYSVREIFRMTCLDRIFLIDDNIQKIQESFANSTVSEPKEQEPKLPE